MAKVSTRQFHFSRFGGYSGLQYVLEQDLVEIPDLRDGELTRPGRYLDVLVSELISHGHGKYTVQFTTSSGSFLHEQTCNTSVFWFSGLRAGTRIRLLSLGLIRKRYTAGYLNGEYYLIAPDKLVEAEFGSAGELLEYCRDRQINLRGVEIVDLQIGE